MSDCYIFHNGKLLLKSDKALPNTADAEKFQDLTDISGFVDRDGNSDRWLLLKRGSEIPSGYSAFERRNIHQVIGEEKLWRMAKAFHYADWRRRYKFCGLCGGAMKFDEHEFAMKCTQCGEFYYPVICPAIIVAVEKEGKILLGHGVNFPPGRYSVIAGFVEPGESLEECVKREVYEETKIRVKNVKYFGSQEWAFPRSLMVGFTAEWESGEITPDKSELADAQWFTPDAIPEYYKGVSISARLIEDFIKRRNIACK